MVERDQDSNGDHRPIAELLARLAKDDQPEAPTPKDGISARVDTLVAGLVQAAGGDWPTVEEMRRLPAEDFTHLARQLSLVIDRLTALRTELLGGDRRRPF